MLSKTTRRPIAVSPGFTGNHCELFYFDGTNVDALMEWSNGEVTLEDDVLSVAYANSGGRRTIEPNSYVIHTRGSNTSLTSHFYYFDVMVRRIAVLRYNQVSLLPAGSQLPGRSNYYDSVVSGQRG